MATISALGIGSGMDLNGLLDQLEAAERQKLAPINRQKGVQQAKISAFGRLSAALSQLQVATARLNNPDLYSAVRSNVSGSAVTAVATGTPAAGSYRIDVHHLAQAASVATAGVDDKNASLGEGTITFTLGNGNEFSLAIDEDNSSLEAIRDAINREGQGVRASIVNDGSDTPFRLVLAADRTGTDGDIAAVDFGALASHLSLDEDTRVEALNASLTVNGIAITSQGNRVEGAIEGVSLDLKDAGTAALSVTSDTQGLKDAVKGFVNSYNALRKTVAELTAFNADTGARGDLLGDTTLRGVQSQLRLVVGGVVEGSVFERLSDIGIQLQLDGTLQLDEERLDALVTSQAGDLRTFFAGSAGEGSRVDGLAGLLGDKLDQMLRTGGVIETATKSLDAGIKRLDERLLRMEKSIDATISRYRIQFGQLDTLIASMNATSTYLTQQFDIMNAQLNRR